MSYRSLKRALGETNLERKCRNLFGVCLFVLITVSFLGYGRKTEELVAQQNPSKGNLLVNTVLVLTHWEHWKDDQPKFDPDYDKLVQHMVERLKSDEYNWKFLNPNPVDDSDQPEDQFEREVMARFRAMPPPQPDDEPRPDLYQQERFTSGGKRYEYYRPIYARAICVGCHLAVTGPTDLAEGDLMAVAKVNISNEQTQRDQNWNRAILIAFAIVASSLAMIALYVVVRYVIVKPLKHLRDVMDAVSRGNLEQRAEIRTADEFEDLAVAFNRMLAHLITAQDELRRVNSDLDLKVDELAQANMRLFELNRLKSDFLATMSHELRTPLNSIIGFSDVLSSIKSLDDKQRRYVQNIQKSGKMLLDMINDILDLAKIESGKMDVRLADFRIEHVIHAQCDMARPLTEKKNIDLEAELDPRLPEMHQDQGKVQQILNNLLTNAIKFTPEGGRITITAKRGTAGDLLLVVADTGIGIAEADQTQVFEKFRQGRTVMPAGDAMTREYSGTGLGLSIVKELCKLLGGEIGLESELGKGSVFTVRLPWRLIEQPRLEPALADAADELDLARLEHAEPSAARALSSPT